MLQPQIEGPAAKDHRASIALLPAVRRFVAGLLVAEQPAMQRLAADAHRILPADPGPGDKAIERHGEIEDDSGHSMSSSDDFHLSGPA
jgi:hypothetical protein